MTDEAYLTLTSKDLLCLVCQDRASGNHYGVPTCDGCRGFFKRSVRKSAAYTCKNEGRCKVDALRRNQCQACRYRKCLEVRMNPEAVQLLRECRSSKRKIEETNDENRPDHVKKINTRPLSSPGIDSSINSSENSDQENSKIIKSEELSPTMTPVRESKTFNPFMGFPSSPHLPFSCHPLLRPDLPFPLVRPSSQFLPPPLLLRPDLLSAFNPNCLSPIRGMPCMFFTCPLCLDRILQSGVHPLRLRPNHGFNVTSSKGQVA